MKTRYLLLSILILIITCSYLFHIFYQAERRSKIDEILGHQKIHAKQAARGFNELFEKWNSVLLYLSEEQDIISATNRGKLELDLLLNIFGSEIKGITRVNNAGKIIYTTPFYPNSIGADISKQKHMVKILSDHKPVISDVFYAVQGYQAIVIHVPIYKDGKFDGTIAFLLNFQEIAKKILNEIKMGNSGYAWMISRDGIELYCPIPGHPGKSIFETSLGFPNLVELAKKMTSGKEGIALYNCNLTGKTVGLVEKTAYYIPVKIYDTFWSIAVVYSIDEITASLSVFRNKLIVIFTFIFIGGIFISFFVIKAWIVIKETAARKVAENDLVESEKRFEQLIEGLPQLVWTTTPEGLCDFLSNQWIEYTGIPESEQLGTKWLEQIHPDDRNDLIIAWNMTLETGSDFQKEFRIRRRDGTYSWFDSRALPLKNLNGKIVKWFGSSTDIQNEYDTRIALKESNERYRLISSAASDYMFSSMVNERGSLSHDWVGGAFESITGYDLKEYVARGGWRAALHPEDVEKDNRDFQKLNSNQSITSELRTITKSGKIVWVHIYASPVWDERNNRLKGITGAVQNITERKNAEDLLRTSEEKFAKAFFSNPESITISKLSTGELLELNEGFEKLYGYTREDALGKTSAELLLYQSSEIRDSIIEKLQAGEKVKDFETTVRRKSGGLRKCTVSIELIQFKGEACSVTTIRDITENKKNLEELILAKEKAEDAIKVKNVFLANMSHELRTPLIGILGYSEMLINELVKQDALEMAKGIRRSGTRLLNTLNLILDLTRIESDKFELNIKTTNLSTEIEYVYNLFYGAALDKKINFTLQFIDRDLYAKVDERIFKIIMENLINNAIKFTSKGSITIIAGIEKKKTVYIEVKDTGIGIAKEHQEVIFEEFRQASEGISRDYQGTGLGLSITKKYVEILGGNVSVVSELDSGSSFILRFPLLENVVPASDDLFLNA